MAPEEKPVGRQHPAHGVHERLDRPTLVFLTVSTRERRRVLATSQVAETLHELWQNEARAWLVGDYVIMPDHLHLFCAPTGFPSPTPIENWVKFWKSRASTRLAWGPAVWERDGFHHRIRDAADYQEKWSYFRQNPVVAGLSVSFEEWPYRGQVNRLEWIG